MKTIVISSHKGGTGKTTTAITLGHRLAQLGERVLLVDLDPQGNLGDYLGVMQSHNVYQVLIERIPLVLAIESTGRTGLDILPGSAATANAQKQLPGLPGFDRRLKRALSEVEREYDYCLIDTAPSLGLLQVLAFVAADLLLVPTELSYASGTGVTRVLEAVAMLRQEVDCHVRLAGVLPTKWDRRLSESDRQLELLAERFPGRVWLPIPVDAKAVEAPAYGATLWEYAPGCAALSGRWVGTTLVGGYDRACRRLLLTEVSHE